MKQPYAGKPRLSQMNAPYANAQAGGKVLGVQLLTCYFHVFWVSWIQIGNIMQIVYMECMNES